MAAHLAANLPLDLRTGPEGSRSGILRTGWQVVPVPPHRGPPPAAGIRPRRAARRRARRAGRAAPLALPQADGSGAAAGRGGAERCAAAPGASRPSRPRPPPRAALLVDDVHTTGATLDVCARALKAEGAEWVGAITYVRTL